MAAGKVKVPQKDGSLTITYDGDASTAHTFVVKDHIVSARDDRDLLALLRLDGATLSEGDVPTDDGAPAV